MFGVPNTCIVECNMPVIGKFRFLVITFLKIYYKKKKKKKKKNLRSSNFSTPGRCLGAHGGARARSRAFPEKDCFY